MSKYLFNIYKLIRDTPLSYYNVREFLKGSKDHLDSSEVETLKQRANIAHDDFIHQIDTIANGVDKD